MKTFLKKLSGLAGTINLREQSDQPADDDVIIPEDEYEEEEAEETEEEEAEEEEFEETQDEEEAEEEEAEETEEEQWPKEGLEEEGQLSIDVFQTPDSIVVKSTIAGVKPEDIDISINNDLLTVRGRRTMQEKVRDQEYLFRECYWGAFSRSIILPVEIESDKIEAELQNGVLTVILPKARNAKPIQIKVREK